MNRAPEPTLPARIRLAIIEDQRLVQESLVRSLESHLSVEIVARPSSHDEVKRDLALLATADVALVDLVLGEATALELIPLIRKAAPRLKLVWLTGAAEEYLVTEAAESALPGFVHKDDDIRTLVTAIEQVASGRNYVSPHVRQLMNSFRAKPTFYKKILTVREQEVLSLVGQGLSNAEAAAILGLSPGTLQAHRRNLMLKLNAHTAAELQSIALKGGFTRAAQLK